MLITVKNLVGAAKTIEGVVMAESSLYHPGYPTNVVVQVILTDDNLYHITVDNVLRYPFLTTKEMVLRLTSSLNDVSLRARNLVDSPPK